MNTLIGMGKRRVEKGETWVVSLHMQGGTTHALGGVHSPRQNFKFASNFDSLYNISWSRASSKKERGITTYMWFFIRAI
jgi:hypothetical protein